MESISVGSLLKPTKNVLVGQGHSESGIRISIMISERHLQMKRRPWKAKSAAAAAGSSKCWEPDTAHALSWVWS